LSFVTLAALALAVLVAAPFAAHLLRRKQAEERPFPAARLVPPTQPTARRRSLLEDRALFALRAASVLALAALGATPFVSCSRLSLSRRSGASVALAIIVDDSLSMRAPLDGGAASPSKKTRWARAIEGARELTQGLRAGDAVAVVLAGAPPRVALASTTDMAAVSATLAGLEPSDRATDLDGAVALGRGLVRGLAQPDKRVVVLSDLADGRPDAPALSSQDDVSLWAPLTELVGPADDCAITRADRAGTKVTARIVCTPSRGPAPAGNATSARTAATNRRVVIRAEGDGAKPVAQRALAPTATAEDVTLDVSEKESRPLTARLEGDGAAPAFDAIAEDDQAPVLASGGALEVAVIVDPATAHVATGGAPPIEQAFSALQLDVKVHPLPTVPERPQDLASISAMIVDDAPGFTPEVRRALAGWVEKGGVALFTLGPRAAGAPLGASFDPLVPGVVRWTASPATGVEPASASVFGASADGLGALAPRGRASLDADVTAAFKPLASWKDGAPFLVQRALGRGAVLALTLPLSAEESDLVLRPAFLALLERFVATARARGGARRVDVGEAWTFDGYKSVKIERAPAAKGDKPVPIAVTAGEGATRDEGAPARAADAKIDVTLHAAPPLAGLYELTLDGEKTARVAGVPEREVDFRARKVDAVARAPGLGGVASSLDASPYVALGLLALLAAELLVRALLARREAT
jgi:hypothetical protein